MYRKVRLGFLFASVPHLPPATTYPHRPSAQLPTRTRLSAEDRYTPGPMLLPVRYGKIGNVLETTSGGKTALKI